MAALPGITWTLKTQPARHFSWRVRASGWLWALGDDPGLARTDYDLIIATSLTGVVPLRAMCAGLRSPPLLTYFHENQFAHPRGDTQSEVHRVGWQFQSLQNAFCADWISFNTAYNRDTFLEGAASLLRRFPERLPGDPLRRVSERSGILPVPLTEEFESYRSSPKDPSLIVWNHRWEWDKQPKRFLAALRRLSEDGIDFRLAMMGCGGGRDNTFAGDAAALAKHIVHWGEADAATYRQWIRKAGIGVSTAVHDFQGLSMLEVAQAGATAVVPRRLAYPECLPGAHFYEGSATDAAKDTADLEASLRALLTSDAPRKAQSHPVPIWTKWKDQYKERIEAVAAMHRLP
jgi:glycosyltransferase involved in cell wall biosynthesis